MDHWRASDVFLMLRMLKYTGLYENISTKQIRELTLIVNLAIYKDSKNIKALFASSFGPHNIHGAAVPLDDFFIGKNYLRMAVDSPNWPMWPYGKESRFVDCDMWRLKLIYLAICSLNFTNQCLRRWKARKLGLGAENEQMS